MYISTNLQTKNCIFIIYWYYCSFGIFDGLTLLIGCFQMLVCPVGDEESPDESEIFKKKDKDKRHQSNHGITPPLKNVRKRRFRKVLRKKYQEQPDIEKEVKRLFRMDNEAISVEWEVVVDDDDSSKGDNPGEGGEKVLAHGGNHRWQYAANYQ